MEESKGAMRRRVQEEFFRTFFEGKSEVGTREVNGYILSQFPREDGVYVFLVHDKGEWADIQDKKERKANVERLVQAELDDENLLVED